ncbi:DUF3781 domain-containing protein [Loigolactobacillus backii]|uniref:DUF3781 domain-containing protein n=1 Tax=Loigolactobacillus backii TaxID=375175 RepID=UPI002FDD2389
MLTQVTELGHCKGFEIKEYLQRKLSHISSLNSLKHEITNSVCYTPLVYNRINKKLKEAFTNHQIEDLVKACINDADSILKKGKNYYVNCSNPGISLTINANNYRVITANNLC